jgi:hypothetical protein
MPPIPAVHADEPAFLSRRVFGLTETPTTAIATGDMNGDGHLDLVIANGVLMPPGDEFSSLVYLNDGAGNFHNGPVDAECSATPNVRCFGAPDDTTLSVAVADIDQDGDLDIIAGQSRHEGTIYLNDGQATFAQESDCNAHDAVRCFGSASEDIQSVAAGDMNSDGHLDIVIGNASGQNRIHFNDGAGNFVVAPLTNPDLVGCTLEGVECVGTINQTSSIALGDINGDGLLDVVAGNDDSQNIISLNRGAGDFYHGDVSCGSTPDTICIGSEGDTTTSVAIGDLNQNGHLDILVGNRGTFNTLSNRYQGAENYIAFNDGSGNFDTTSIYTLPFATTPDATNSVAPGDLDHDGDLDIIIGNSGEQNTLYLNDGAGGFSPPARFGSSTSAAQGIALADIDSDSDLDVLIGNASLQNEIYINNGAGDIATSSTTTQLFGSGDDHTRSIATGDMDGDGTLDLVLGNEGEQNAVYLNSGSGTFAASGARLFGNATSATTSIAVGDIDGDSDLDIVAGGENIVYLNAGDGTFHTGAFACGVTRQIHCFGTSAQPVNSVALADMDGDDDLDILAGNGSGWQNHMYLNQGSVPRFHTGAVACDPDRDGEAVRCFGMAATTTTALAVGDLDSDGNTDVVVANSDQANALYLNDGAGALPEEDARPFGSGFDDTQSVAVGDVDGDGDLDIVSGNDLEQNMVFINDGTASFVSDTITCGVTPGVFCFGTGLDRTLSITLADIDADSDLDIITGNSQDQSAVYLNNGVGSFTVRRTFGAVADTIASIAVADFDQDGDLDLAAGLSREQTRREDQNLQNRIYFNGLVAPTRLDQHMPSVRITRPGSTSNGAGFSTSEILATTIIPIRYQLSGVAATQVGSIRAFYSPDGGGRWLPARTPNQTHIITTGLELNTPMLYQWDTFASGFFGQSDNVIFRIEAYPATQTGADRMAGPYRHPYAAAQSFPFRVRGTQVRVLNNGNPARDSLVYRLPADAVRNGDPLTSSDGTPFRTNALGYLEGRGTLALGDRLIAITPIETHDTYTLYYTNATPTPEGVTTHTIEQPGVQTLTVSALHPLILFDFDVSLEWDARKDLQFLEQLIFDLQRTSENLYDWSEGQIALGSVRIYQDLDYWEDADIRIFASNRIRPNADQGGILRPGEDDDGSMEDPTAAGIVYQPGQVRMGAVWNRYGDTGGNLGEDWPRGLAHELGHYALFLDDNYLGLDDTTQVIIPVDSCPGAMSDPYNDKETEFHPAAQWLPACEQTLSNRTTGRSDWQTIQTFYPAVQLPSTPFAQLNTGPSILPFNATSIEVIAPETDSSRLIEVPIFSLVDEQGRPLETLPSARAYLFDSSGDYVADLGNPILDQVRARGAAEGDRLCVYDLEQALLGCERITQGDEQVQLQSQPAWQPDVRITPVTSHTIDIAVEGVNVGEQLLVELYPENNPVTRVEGETVDDADLCFNAEQQPSATYRAELERSGDVYRGRLELCEPALAGRVHVWVPGSTEGSPPARSIVTEYSLGGNPGLIRQIRSNRSRRRVRGRRTYGRRRSRGVRRSRGRSRSRRAPAVSSDGQVIVYVDEKTFQERPGEFYSLQPATNPPAPPPWKTRIGQSYRLIASPDAPDLQTASLSFAYLGDDIPIGEEDGLQISFWDEEHEEWIPLETTLNPEENVAAVNARGPGLYSLMSSINIALDAAGWNLVPYPLEEQRPVADALRSIEQSYTTVYGYAPGDAADPWKGYANPAAPRGEEHPDWVNDLDDLEPEHAYWIEATRAITVAFGGAPEAYDDAERTARTTIASSIPNPPATCYARLAGSEVFSTTLPTTRTAGMPVVARVDGQVCGEAQTRREQGSIVFAVDVATEWPGGNEGCGAPGRHITFEVGGVPLAKVLAWPGSGMRDIFFEARIYLPVVAK